ncbi:uncharacterized protein [Chaetodon trifascialis]|uniref:uncharacterized protein n=1 Tax=Chaetodon trifascialis TaxID=109706 RepID=UPI003992B744
MKKPVALTSVVMKSFERLVLSHLKDITDPFLDPLQILFVDFNSAFNTIIPTLLQEKLSQLNVPDTTCRLITDFLSDRKQCVKLGKHGSDAKTISTGSPQGCVLSPLLFSLFMRDESSRLSLRRLFSTVSLSRTRTGSLDRLSSRLYPTVHDPTPCPRKSSSLLKKTLSVQSLSGLRKSSSVQNFGSDQKRKKDRSADYRPAAEQFLQRCLSLEDVGCPCSVRSVGRVLQVYSDGTFLLEVSRPKNRIYGFIISRGRGRPDSGVYVEDMVDSSTEKLYAGLLTVGDELLEVNGEKVASLSLDQVTHLLIQNPSATIRVLRHRRTSPQ